MKLARAKRPPVTTEPAGELDQLQVRIDEAEERLAIAVAERDRASEESHRCGARCRKLTSGLPRAEDPIAAQKRLDEALQELAEAQRKTADLAAPVGRIEAELHGLRGARHKLEGEALSLREHVAAILRARWYLFKKLDPRRREVAALEAQLAKSLEQERAARERLGAIGLEGDEGPDAAAA